MNIAKASKTLFSNVHEGTGSKLGHFYGPLKKLAGNSDNSKSDNF